MHFSAQKVLELKNVSFRYSETSALKNITLSVNLGEKVVFLGANGSGKSTLLKILDALIFPTIGEYFAFGWKIDEEFFKEEDLRFSFRQNVGYLFQDSDVQLFSPTVWDDVIFAPLHMKMSKTKVIDRGNWAMKLMEITKLKNRMPHSLSGGEKKRVAIASVLSYKPKLWLFDEPTSGLDPKSQSTLIDFIYSMDKKENTVIIATHDLSFVHEITERVIVISEDHKIVADDKPERILSDLKLLKKHNLIHDHRHKHLKKDHVHDHIHSVKHKHGK